MSELPLSADSIRAGLKTSFVGQSLVYLPETGSTNAEARRLAEKDAPDGTLVITDHQTAGRGRLDRRWEALPGSSLLMSLIFRPQLAPHQVQHLTMLGGLATADAVEAETGLKVGLKWPNDLMIGGAKAGGILAEVELSGDRILYALVGIGVNVNLDPERLPGPLLTRATSLSLELGRPVSRLALLWSLLKAIEIRYLALGTSRSRLQVEWAERLVTLGQQVIVSTGGTAWQGIAEGVDEDGALLVRSSRADGRLDRIMAGDVTVR
jgi:BirA family transcriptional regulator, biotin operon repressor / biotin---[acetyl-CoA-carboxylase] ligase